MNSRGNSSYLIYVVAAIIGIIVTFACIVLIRNCKAGAEANHTATLCKLPFTYQLYSALEELDEELNALGSRQQLPTGPSDFMRLVTQVTPVLITNPFLSIELTIQGTRDYVVSIAIVTNYPRVIVDSATGYFMPVFVFSNALFRTTTLSNVIDEICVRSASEQERNNLIGLFFYFGYDEVIRDHAIARIGYRSESTVARELYTRLLGIQYGYQVYYEREVQWRMNATNSSGQSRP